MSTELSTAATFIYSKITGDAILSAAIGTRVYEDAAPRNTDYPCVVFSSIDPDDTVACGGNTVKSDLDYTIRVIDITSYAEIDPLAERLKIVFHNTSDGNVIHCGRKRPFNRMYDLNNIRYYERGGVYEIMVQGA